MSGFAPPPKFRLTPEGEAAVKAMRDGVKQVGINLELALAPLRPMGVRAMQRALDSAPSEPEPDLRDDIVDALRNWRWHTYSDLHRGESPYSVQREDVRLAKLIELIDEHDIAMGVEEPKCSFVKRARMFIDRAERDGLTEEELAKVLAWLGDGSKAP